MSNNKELARRDFEDVWNENNLVAIDEIFSPDLIGHFPGNPNFGLEWYKQWVVDAHTAWPDMHFDIEDVIEEKKIRL